MNKDRRRSPIETKESSIKNAPAPIAWTIAGSDPGGGAGIQVDLKVMNAFGVHGCSVVTALTAQNTLGVQAAEPVCESMFQSQLESLAADLPAAAIKTGMLGSTANCRILADFLNSSNRPLVCDPILKSTSGARLIDPAALDLLVQGIFPHVTVLTPNLPEAQHLLNISSLRVEEAAERFLSLGVQSVLMKGGHAAGDDCNDYWTDGQHSLWLSSPRIETRASHGTGCILSSAIASALALGQPLPEAITTAKTFLNQCLHAPAHIGAGHGPMRIAPFLNRMEHRPTIQ